MAGLAGDHLALCQVAWPSPFEAWVDNQFRLSFIPIPRFASRRQFGPLSVLPIRIVGVSLPCIMQVPNDLRAALDGLPTNE